MSVVWGNCKDFYCSFINYVLGMQGIIIAPPPKMSTPLSLEPVNYMTKGTLQKLLN